MIDSHCHLTDERLGNQLDSVLARCAAAGVSRMITIGTGIEDSAKAIAVCRGRDNLRCTIGIHPNYSKSYVVDDVTALRGLNQADSVLALGEMGLDYHYDYAPKAHQAEIFEAQLSLASEFNRPVVIHCREAVDDTLGIMRKYPSVPAVFHCFTGTLPEAKKILDDGYLIGFTGAVTFKKADELREVARMVPADRFLVETDAPYLTPEPMRKQKVNEPSLVVHVAEVIAQARGTNREEIDQITTGNVVRLFGRMT
jgi:TatD DNase family protein